MKTTVLPLLLAASAVAHPAARYSMHRRACTPGRLVCNGDSKFALCQMDSSVVWMQVADGTKCVCSGSDCTIAAAEGSAPSGGNGSEPQNPPSQATNPPTTDPVTPPPAQSSAPPPAQSSAPPSGGGGVFIEDPNSEAPPATTASAPPAVTSAQAPPAQSSSASDSGDSGDSGSRNAAGHAYIKTLLGDGSPSEGWPAVSQWVSWDNMWASNLANVISKSCAGFGQKDNSPSESAALKSAIENTGRSTGIDPRYILAIVMQESNGCVRAPTTNYGVTNPGLMQSHNGKFTCAGTVPCPTSEVDGMINDGVKGTADGDGLQQLLQKAGGSAPENYYRAARMYNSGSIASSGLLQDGIATHCYVSDIANRLLGWSEGTSSCSL